MSLSLRLSLFCPSRFASHQSMQNRTNKQIGYIKSYLLWKLDHHSDHSLGMTLVSCVTSAKYVLLKYCEPCDHSARMMLSSWDGGMWHALESGLITKCHLSDRLPGGISLILTLELNISLTHSTLVSPQLYKAMLDHLPSSPKNLRFYSTLNINFQRPLTFLYKDNNSQQPKT